MKAFVTSMVALVVISFAAWGVLTSLDYSAQDAYRSGHGTVRL
ncbi:hypothetical protein ACKTEK_03850 [Tepidamorphus sp. 3E244]